MIASLEQLFTRRPTGRSDSAFCYSDRLGTVRAVRRRCRTRRRSPRDIGPESAGSRSRADLNQGSQATRTGTGYHAEVENSQRDEEAIQGLRDR